MRSLILTAMAMILLVTFFQCCLCCGPLWKSLAPEATPVQPSAGETVAPRRRLRVGSAPSSAPEVKPDLTAIAVITPKLMVRFRHIPCKSYWPAKYSGCHASGKWIPWRVCEGLLLIRHTRDRPS